MAPTTQDADTMLLADAVLQQYKEESQRTGKVRQRARARFSTSTLISSSIFMRTGGLNPDLSRTSVTPTGELHKLSRLTVCLGYLPAWELVSCRTQRPTEAGRPPSSAWNRPLSTQRRAPGSSFALRQTPRHVRRLFSTLL